MQFSVHRENPIFDGHLFNETIHICQEKLLRENYCFFY
jgi:hypothetical protein